MARKVFGARTVARSQALQLLFQAEACERKVQDVVEGPFVVCQDSEGEDTETQLLDEFGAALALGADDLRPELDAIIASVSRNWAVSRMPAVDRNLLRLAIYEMLMVDDVAIPITIDESVELAKAFGTDESSRFVNGVLGRVAERIESGHDLIAEATEMLEREAAEAAAKKAAAEEAAAAEAAEAEAADGDAVEAEDKDEEAATPSDEAEEAKADDEATVDEASDEADASADEEAGDTAEQAEE